MVRFPSQSRYFSLPALNILFSLCASFTNVSTKIRSTPLKLYNPIPPRMTADGLPPCAMFSTCTVALGNARCNHCFQRAGQAQSFPAIPRFEALCQQSPPSVNEPPNTWQRSAKTYCLGASPCTNFFNLVLHTQNYFCTHTARHTHTYTYIYILITYMMHNPVFSPHNDSMFILICTPCHSL